VARGSGIHCSMTQGALHKGARGETEKTLQNMKREEKSRGIKYAKKLDHREKRQEL